MECHRLIACKLVSIKSNFIIGNISFKKNYPNHKNRRCSMTRKEGHHALPSESTIIGHEHSILHDLAASQPR